MNLVHLLTSFEGRINRAKFWLAALIYAIVILALVVLAVIYSGLMWIAMPVYLLVMFSSLAVGVKRLHDRNKSGWWLLWFYATPIVLSAIGYYAFGGYDESSASTLAQILAFASFGINIWALIELGFLRGSIGPNQYGSDPLLPQPAPPRTLR